MGKSAPSPPPPPDPVAVANAQAAANKDTAYATAQLNRVNQATPYGNVTYSNSLGNIDTIPGAAATGATNPSWAFGGQTFNSQQEAQDYAAAHPTFTDNGDTRQQTAPDITYNAGGATGASPTSYKIGSQSFNSLDDAQKFLNENGTWTQTTTLTPEEQKALGSQQSLTQSLFDLANQQSGRISSTLAKPLSFDNLPSLVSGLDTSKIPTISTGNNIPTGLDYSRLPAMPGSPQSTNDQVSQAMYRQATSRLDPQWQQAEQRINDQLSQQGIPVGSDAYDKAMGEFSRAKNDAYNSALNASIVSGAQQGSTDYGLALQGVDTGVGTQTANASIAGQAAGMTLAQQQAAAAQSLQEQEANAQLAAAARQQGISESTYLYNQPLNEAIALMGGGQIQGPQAIPFTPTSVAPTDVTGAYGLAQQGNLAGYQAKVANQSANTGGMAGIAGSALTAAALFF